LKIILSDNHKHTLVLLLALNGISILAMQFIVPAMPDIQNTFNTTSSKIQLILTIFMLGYSISQVVYGPLSDRFGRRPVMIWSLIMFVVGSLLGAFAEDINILIVARLIQAIGAAGGFVLPPAVARDVYGPEGSRIAIGWISIAAGFSALLAPFAGGFIHETYGWRLGMILMALIGLIMLLLTYFFLNESNINSRIRSINFFLLAKNYKEVFYKKFFVQYFFGLALVNGVFYAFFAGTSFIASENLNLSPSEFGLMMAPIVIAFVPSAYLSVKLANRFSGSLIITIGSSFSLLSSLFIVFLALNNNISIFFLVIASIFLGWGNGHVIPIATSNAINLLPSKAGTASAALGTGSMLAGALASMIFGIFHDGTALPMAIIMTVMALVAFVACLSIIFFEK
tara:strand:+ start:566 stop:1759 length:1194 start_codon:yes stop_codon:yes gene_type:complete